MAEELIPCPFCGGGIVEKNTPQCNTFLKRPVTFWLRCENNCVEQCQTYETPLEAIKAWNRRVNS